MTQKVALTAKLKLELLKCVAMRVRQEKVVKADKGIAQLQQVKLATSARERPKSAAALG